MTTVAESVNIAERLASQAAAQPQGVAAAPSVPSIQGPHTPMPRQATPPPARAPTPVPRAPTPPPKTA